MHDYSDDDTYRLNDLPAGTYVCAHCHNEYAYGQSHERADAEALQQWGVVNAHNDPSMDVICDDCYLAMFGKVASSV